VLEWLGWGIDHRPRNDSRNY